MADSSLAEELADYYIRALEEQGLKIPSDGRGYERLLKDGSVRWEIRRQLMEMDSSDNNSQGYLIQKLLQDAIIQYGERQQRREEIHAVARLADFYRAAHDAQMELWQRMARAAHDERLFTDVEFECYAKLIKRRRKNLRAARANAGDRIDRAAQAVVDRENLEKHGLLFDRQMTADVDTLLGNALQGRPTLLIGDKGIAKTQLARFVCSLYCENPVVISIKGDTTTADFIGRAQDAASPYPDGALPYAMEHGVPVLLDELNFGNQGVMACLHDVLLRRPHDKVFFPALGRHVEVAPGFAVFATANEASDRYLQRQVLDPALRDRFEILYRSYPDLDADVAAAPCPTLMRMALASIVDGEGVFSRHIDDEMLENFVRVASITQRLYVLEARAVAPHIEDKGIFENATMDRPLIGDCISARTVCRMASDSALGSLPGRNLDLFLIDSTIKTLDQDGSGRNADAVRRVAIQASIDLFDRFAEDEEDEFDEVGELN